MITYAMSSVGMCARTLSATRLGLLPSDGGPVPEYLRLAAREGSRHEQWIKDDLPEHGFTSVDAGYLCKPCGRSGVHVELIAGDTTKLKFVGHIDDYVYPNKSPGNIYIAEYKALGKYMSYALKDGIEDHRTYSTQVSLYYYAQAEKSELPILYAIKNRDTGSMNIMVYEQPPIELNDIILRLYKIEDYIANNEMAPCDADRDGPDKYHCTGLCDEGKELEMPVPESVNKEVSNYRAAFALESEAAELKTASRGVFRAYLNGSGRKSARIDGMLLTWIPDGTRKVHDIPDEVKRAFERQTERPGYLRITDNKEG